MITTKTLVRKTGLSAKTLTRWSNQGIIPKPAIRTYPSGRGKIGYWPDAVLAERRIDWSAHPPLYRQAVVPYAVSGFG